MKTQSARGGKGGAKRTWLYKIRVRPQKAGQSLITREPLLADVGHDCCSFLAFFFFFILTLGHAYWYSREGNGGRKRGRETSSWERNIDLLSFTAPRTRDQTHNLGMCPDHESNRPPCSLWGNAPTNWATSARVCPGFWRLLVSSNDYLPSPCQLSKNSWIISLNSIVARRENK